MICLDGGAANEEVPVDHTFTVICILQLRSISFCLCRRIDGRSYSDKPDVLVFAEDGCEMQAIELVEQLCKEGKKAQFSVLSTLKETQQFAAQRGIAEVKVCSR